ncbi:MAG: lysozyme inhibitor LprI family protein [Caulobacteraceae bacterium]|nr:lysozyme inhibitor LprI family protein [Caulobacteraceae bacterium]
MLTLTLAGAARAAECPATLSDKAAFDCITRAKATAEAALAAEERAWPNTEPMQRAHAAFLDFRDAQCRAEAMTALPKASGDLDHLVYDLGCQEQLSEERTAQLRRLRGLAKSYR